MHTSETLFCHWPFSFRRLVLPSACDAVACKDGQASAGPTRLGFLSKGMFEGQCGTPVVPECTGTHISIDLAIADLPNQRGAVKSH